MCGFVALFFIAVFDNERHFIFSFMLPALMALALSLSRFNQWKSIKSLRIKIVLVDVDVAEFIFF